MLTNAEINFDGLIGPTHNYGGLSLGNNASQDKKTLLVFKLSII